MFTRGIRMTKHKTDLLKRGQAEVLLFYVLANLQNVTNRETAYLALFHGSTRYLKIKKANINYSSVEDQALTLMLDTILNYDRDITNLNLDFLSKTVHKVFKRLGFDSTNLVERLDKAIVNYLARDKHTYLDESPVRFPVKENFYIKLKEKES